MSDHFDERQCKEMNSMGTKAFYVMFAISVVAILVQLIILDGEFKNVIGETMIMLGGGIVYLIGCMRTGIFSCNGKSLTMPQLILESVVCSGFFSVLYAIQISRKAIEDIFIGKYTGFFFVGISLLCFIVLLVMDKCSRYFQKKREEKYDD